MIIGIDLGTTNSAAACFRDGAPMLIPNALGDLLTPSAVSVAKDGNVLVGLAARERQSTHPELTATAFKRNMGTPKRFALGKRAFGPEGLSSLVLASLKADAERWSGEQVTGAIVTVPAYFNDQQRRATRRAGELAGLKVERLINEPTAAALAYGIQDRGDREPFLVFDLGGGTFDVSIVEVYGGVVEVRASAGDNRLGGEDFNAVVVEMARAAIDPHGTLAPPNKRQHLEEVLRAAAERTRRALSESAEAPFRIVWDGREYAHAITAPAFEAAAAPLLDRLRGPVLRALRDAGMGVADLSDVVMVGGATRMEIVRSAVGRMFRRAPNHSLHPDHAVALGAAIQAGLKARDAALEEVRLTDVCPFTLGVDTMWPDQNGRLVPGCFAPIIPRNTVLPASRIHPFETAADQQAAVLFNIYQGEGRAVADNLHLGQVKVPVPPRRAGEVKVEVRFSYDPSGLLEVDVHVPMTGLQRQWVISEGDSGESAEQLAQRRAALAGLKVLPRDQPANAATLARAARCYENFLGERRERIGALLSAFETALQAQEPHAIEEARRQVEAGLDALEGERFL